MGLTPSVQLDLLRCTIYLWPKRLKFLELKFIEVETPCFFGAFSFLWSNFRRTLIMVGKSVILYFYFPVSSDCSDRWATATVKLLGLSISSHVWSYLQYDSNVIKYYNRRIKTCTERCCFTQHNTNLSNNSSITCYFVFFYSRKCFFTPLWQACVNHSLLQMYGTTLARVLGHTRGPKTLV